MISPDTPPKIIELKKMKIESPESPDSAKMTAREMGYGELVEKYKHYMRSSKQYESLYNEYLEKFILSERQNQILLAK